MPAPQLWEGNYAYFVGRCKNVPTIEESSIRALPFMRLPIYIHLVHDIFRICLFEHEFSFSNC
jgi:hypothetical protein